MGAPKKKSAVFRPRYSENLAEPASVPKPANNTSAVSHPPKQTRMDEENTPDTIRHLLDKLKHGPVDQNIVEEFSLDWRASKKNLDEWLARTKAQPSWLPRQGEIVLFVRNLNGNQIDFDNADGTYNMFSEKESRFIGPPRWEAGVIGQGPSETVTLEEIVHETEKTQNVAYSGFRVEPMSDPNSSDKALSKRYKYVPLHQIRPFVFWQEFLKGIPEDAWHPTIRNALTVASSIALVDKHSFQGEWPKATISCSGVYIGSEFIGLEDTVRLTPLNGDTVTDFLEVSSIKLTLTNLDKASDNDYDDGHPYNTTVLLSGRAFTSDRSRAWNDTHGGTLSAHSLLPKGINGYDLDTLYWLHEPDKKYRISFNRVLGRCFDVHPMMMWFPSAGGDNQQPASLLNYGLAGMQVARIFSSQNDTRILGGKAWYWGDTRLEVLDAEMLNGVHSASHDAMRDERLDEWYDYAKAWKKVGATDIGTIRFPKKGPGKSIMAAVARATATPDDDVNAEDDAIGGEDGPKSESRKRGHSFAENETPPGLFHRSSDDDNAATDSEGAEAAAKAALLEAFKKPKFVVNIDS